jgi:hypothetical protein
MWSNFIRKIVSLLHFLSGETTRQLASQADELKACQAELKVELKVELKAYQVELNANLNELNARTNELKAYQGELKADQETMCDTVCRGFAMVINAQNKILERLDDIEANIKEIKKEKRLEEYSHRK